MTKDLSEVTTHPDKVRPSSAVSRWSMDSSDVSSGVISDSWGSNDGTLNGGITTGASGIGGSEAFSFDGSDDYVDVGEIQSFGSYTLALWIKDDSPYDDLFHDYLRFVRNNELSLQKTDSNRWVIYHNDGESYVRVGTLGATGGWHHLVATWNGKTVRFYVDGLLDESMAISSLNSMNGTLDSIGADQDSSRNYVPGDIDEVRIYSEALDQQQIWKLYNIGRNANWGFSRS